MKTLTLALALLLAPASAIGVSVVADIPSPDTQVCPYTWNGATIAGSVPMVVDTGRGNPVFGHRICMLDIESLNPGAYTIRMKARNVDMPSVWEDSEWSLPFDFVRQGILLPPNSLRLIP